MIIYKCQQCLKLFWSSSMIKRHLEGNHLDNENVYYLRYNIKVITKHERGYKRKGETFTKKRYGGI